MKLFKKTSTGKIQEWSIHVEDNKIITIQGQLGGKVQTYIKECLPKNVGRTNETSGHIQALSEMNSTIKKKKLEGYVEDINLLNNVHSKGNKRSSEGCYLPMKANVMLKHIKKIVYPCYVQPKFDGFRLIVEKTLSGELIFSFGSGRKVSTFDKILFTCDKLLKPGEIIDGELYVHDINFNLVSGKFNSRADVKTDLDLFYNINKKYKDKDEDLEFQLKILDYVIENVRYMVFDAPRIYSSSTNNLLTEEDSFLYRFSNIEERIKNNEILLPCPTLTVNNYEGILFEHKRNVSLGYEGTMVRQIQMIYEQKRSYQILKHKDFKEKEYLIVGYKEGKGVLSGCIGSFSCEYIDNNGMKDTFDCKLACPVEFLRECYLDHSIFMNKFMNVKYQELGENNKPRFDTGLKIRDLDL